jgi:elongation factor G
VYCQDSVNGVQYDTIGIPADMFEITKKYREELIESVADFDENIANKYLEGVEISAEELQIGIRKATLSMKFIGVIPGSSFKNKGVQMLLDAVVDYLPSPLDLPPTRAFDDDGNEVGIPVGDSGKVAALAFKLMTDPYVGKLVFCRVYAGQLRKGSTVYNPRTRQSERIGRLVTMKADAREDIEVAYSGDICAAVGLKNVATGDTLCDDSLDLILEPPTFPEPVISMSIEPKSRADQTKLSTGLQRLAEEDPTFVVTTNQETGQTIIAGMGELHLDIIRDRLFREFNVEADAGRPQIAYKETISTAAMGEGKFIRQTGGHGQYGHAVIKIEPAERGKGIEIINEIVGGVIPREFIKPTQDGIMEGATSGVVAGYPVVDFVARIIDGSFHEVDSSELAFKMAGIFGFKEAMRKASPILLEPIMRVDVSTPDEYQGDVVGDLNRRRGQIHGIEAKHGLTMITAFVPLEMMFGYATDVRSLSKGRATYSMEPAHFEQVPSSLLAKIIENSPNKR